MKKILFVCHGNICRSPMAEYLMKYLAKEKGLEKEYYIESRATSKEEIGNPIHYGTAKILDKLNINYSLKRAKQITKEDVLNYDIIYAMDYNNIYNLERMFGKNDKFKLLLGTKEISDPWYTGNFSKTYEDIMLGLNLIFEDGSSL